MVDGDGFSTFPFDAPARMRGVILNRSAEILDPAPGAPGFLGGMWQVFVQTDMDGDFGGSALWMGQYLGRMNGTHPQGSYSDSAWLDELYRLEHDPASDRPFEPGRHRRNPRSAPPGMAFRGKSNINEMHTIDPAADYDVVLIQANAGLPDPQVITLADLKDATDDFIFDSTRLTGPEHYQGTLYTHKRCTVHPVPPVGHPEAVWPLPTVRGEPCRCCWESVMVSPTTICPLACLTLVGFLDQEDYRRRRRIQGWVSYLAHR